jgi:hypothetical protein
MNEQRDHLLQQLREAAEKGMDSEAFYHVLREATRQGPVPRELLRDIMKRHVAGRVPQEGPVMPPEREEAIREGLRRLHEPSERAQDPDHPVGAVACAIRQALPAFRPWQVDVSEIDLNAAARRLFEDRAQALSYLIPPDFIEESSGAYVTAERCPLIEDVDGSVLTTGELIEKEATQERLREIMHRGSRLSDALGLIWKQPEPLELRAVEELLRDLAERVVPGVPVCFLLRRAPRFRAALRMELGGNPIPAATGGVLNHPSILREGTHVACVTIHLEPWAAARSGQAVELVKGSPFPWWDHEAGASGASIE